jgi:hypothetical protein
LGGRHRVSCNHRFRIFIVSNHHTGRRTSRVNGCATAGAHDEALHYDPNRLVDALREHLGLDNDAELARKLRVRPPTLSKVRNRRVAVSPALLIAMHEASGLTIRDLRWLMGDRREFFAPLIEEESVVIVR